MLWCGLPRGLPSCRAAPMIAHRSPPAARRAAEDGGQSWKRERAADTLAANLYELLFTPAGLGFVLGNDGVLLRVRGGRLGAPMACRVACLLTRGGGCVRTLLAGAVRCVHGVRQRRLACSQMAVSVAPLCTPRPLPPPPALMPPYRAAHCPGLSACYLASGQRRGDGAAAARRPCGSATSTLAPPLFHCPIQILTVEGMCECPFVSTGHRVSNVEESMGKCVTQGGKGVIKLGIRSHTGLLPRVPLQRAQLERRRLGGGRQGWVAVPTPPLTAACPRRPPRARLPLLHRPPAVLPAQLSPRLHPLSSAAAPSPPLAAPSAPSPQTPCSASPAPSPPPPSEPPPPHLPPCAPPPPSLSPLSGTAALLGICARTGEVEAGELWGQAQAWGAPQQRGGVGPRYAGQRLTRAPRRLVLPCPALTCPRESCKRCAQRHCVR